MATKPKWKGITFDSGFEKEFAQHLSSIGVKWEYNTDRILWQPEPKYYTPDFKVWLPDGKFFYIEAKGYFYPNARSKMERLREQYPDLDVRFVFQNAKTKLNSKAKIRPTTYARWAERHNYLWADKEFPIEWRECEAKKNRRQPAGRIRDKR